MTSQIINVNFENIPLVLRDEEYEDGDAADGDYYDENEGKFFFK